MTLGSDKSYPLTPGWDHEIASAAEMILNAARKLDESIEFVGTFGSRRYATDLVAGRLLDHEIDGLPLRPQAAGHKRELGHEAYTMYGAALIWI